MACNTRALGVCATGAGLSLVRYGGEAADTEAREDGREEIEPREQPRNAGGQKSGHISSASTAVITDHSLSCTGKMSSGC